MASSTACTYNYYNKLMYSYSYTVGTHEHVWLGTYMGEIQWLSL